MVSNKYSIGCMYRDLHELVKIKLFHSDDRELKGVPVNAYRGSLIMDGSWEDMRLGGYPPAPWIRGSKRDSWKLESQKASASTVAQRPEGPHYHSPGHRPGYNHAPPSSPGILYEHVKLFDIVVYILSMCEEKALKRSESGFSSRGD